MKKSYLLAFSDDLGTREQVKSWIEKMPSVLMWRYDMSNAFYIISEQSAETIAQELLKIRTTQGRFIIAEIGNNKQGWLTKASWHLLNNKQYMPEEKK